jgi:hypothetical protein
MRAVLARQAGYCLSAMCIRLALSILFVSQIQTRRHSDNDVASRLTSSEGSLLYSQVERSADNNQLQHFMGFHLSNTINITFCFSKVVSPLSDLLFIRIYSLIICRLLL